MEQRLFFDPSNSPSGVFPNTISRMVNANINQQNCADFTVYIQVSSFQNHESHSNTTQPVLFQHHMSHSNTTSLIPTPQVSFQHHKSHSNTTILIPTPQVSFQQYSFLIPASHSGTYLDINVQHIFHLFHVAQHQRYLQRV